MNLKANIILFNAEHHPIRWSLGATLHAPISPIGLHFLLEQALATDTADAWLFWDARLGPPEEERIIEAFGRPGDLWHAGLKLGMGGKPGIINFVSPTWVFNSDPPSDIIATSWRMSLRACLIKSDVLRQMGGPHPTFSSLAGASLEMGYRYILRGVLMRHCPHLIEGRLGEIQETELPLEDELRFLKRFFRPFWVRWALFRAVSSGYAPLGKMVRTWREIRREALAPLPEPLSHHFPSTKWPAQIAPVSVLIPTLDRYPYLRTLLAQLRRQTIAPLEIIVVDQTPITRRDTSIVADFADLPLRMFYLDQAGQCTSRNFGLGHARGDYILFLDDDDEVPPTLIEDHLRTLEHFRAETSSGVVDEIGAGPLPASFTILRASDVFPTNNTMIRKSALHRSGLFDLAYDKGQRADGDLGIRMYQSGALMVLNPHICVLHHHAPRGGLRAHKARVTTYASSRKYITHRNLPSVSECYLMMRYFTPEQVRESLLRGLLGTFALHGNLLRRLFKALVGLVLLPHSIWVIWQRMKVAKAMLRHYPQIPSLSDVEAVYDQS